MDKYDLTELMKAGVDLASLNEGTGPNQEELEIMQEVFSEMPLLRAFYGVWARPLPSGAEAAFGAWGVHPAPVV